MLQVTAIILLNVVPCGISKYITSGEIATTFDYISLHSPIWPWFSEKGKFEQDTFSQSLRVLFWTQSYKKLELTWHQIQWASQAILPAGWSCDAKSSYIWQYFLRVMGSSQELYSAGLHSFNCISMVNLNAVIKFWIFTVFAKLWKFLNCPLYSTPTWRGLLVHATFSCRNQFFLLNHAVSIKTEDNLFLTLTNWDPETISKDVAEHGILHNCVCFYTCDSISRYW